MFHPPRNTLPILLHFLDTYKQWHEIVQHMPKKSRYTIGTKVDALFIEVLELMCMAGMAARGHKVPYLEKAIRRFDVLKFFLRVAWEIKALDNKKYILLTERLAEIGRMLGGWYRNALKQNSRK